MHQLYIDQYKHPSTLECCHTKESPLDVLKTAAWTAFSNSTDNKPFYMPNFLFSAHSSLSLYPLREFFSYVPVLLNPLFTNGHFLTWLPIVPQPRCQLIRSHVRKWTSPWQDHSSSLFTHTERLHRHQGPLLLTWFNQHGWLITSIMKCGMKLLSHSQTSTVASLKFGNGQVISSYT